MRGDWVAASVRVRAMATQRVGAGGARRIAAQPSLAAGLALLSGTVYGPATAGAGPLAAAERAVRATALWQLRVLGGWLPQSGSALARAVAAEYEAENILALAAGLAGETAAEPFELGALATAWPRLREAASPTELAALLRGSRWGVADVAGGAALRDLLTLRWWGRLAALSAPTRPWARTAAALTAARVVLVDGTEPSPLLRHAARPLVGDQWSGAHTLAQLRDALPTSARGALADVGRVEDLWRAEARLRATMEADGFRLLRAELPGPSVVLGGLTVLGVDSWRVRAALAAAAVGAGSSEVLDAVA